MRVALISRTTLFEVPGGDTVQIQQTANALEKIGIATDIIASNQNLDYAKYDLLHFFNIIRPNVISCHTKASNLPYLISTIFVDYSEIERSNRSLPFRLLSRIIGSDRMEYLKTVARAILNGEKILDLSYLFRGHKNSVESLLNGASCLLPNSESEFNRLKKRYRFSNKYKVVPNAVSDDFFEEHIIDTDRSGLICVGRIEVIKNQLNLIKAVNGTGIQLKIIGKPAPNHQGYFQECERIAGENVEFLGQLSKDEVVAEMKKAKTHILPSFFETTGLSTLEAAACGCNIIVTPKGDTREYFRDYAFYCDPSDPANIREVILKAEAVAVNPELRSFVKENYRWSMAAKITKVAYEETLLKQ